MKITHVIVGLNDGGAEAVLYQLCSKDCENKHSVVALMGRGKYADMLEKNGIEVICLNMKRGGISIRGLYGLWSFLRNTKPDVVQTWMYHADLIGGLVAYLLGIKKIFWNIHHTNLDQSFSKRSTIIVARLCAKLSFKIPTGILCCAKKSLEIHRDFGYCSKKLKVISNGYDLNYFEPNFGFGLAVRKEFSIPDDIFLLGMVARFDPLKDHRNLLQALSVLRGQGVSFRCLLIGTGINGENIKLTSLIEYFDLVGVVKLLDTRKDIPAIMNALDIHVLSSVSEAFPNVVAEAMACGTPVVATDVGDAATIIGDTGWVVPPENSQALANALCDAFRLLPSERLERGRHARERIEKFYSIDKMLLDYNGVWSCD